MTTKTKTRKAKAQSNVSKVNSREILYPKPFTDIHDQSNPITIALTKKLLGWTIVKDEEEFYHLKDKEGNRIFLSNNISNRPIYTGNVFALMQEQLRNRWQYNREPIIIGETGLILNGQHSLIAHVMAEQERQLDKEKWSEYWTKPITLCKDIAYGCREEDDVINTLDTCKKRSLMDVLYRSSYFEDLPTGARKKCAKILDFSVRLIWKRTGVGEAYSIVKTYSETLDFIAQHPTLLEIVSFIFKLDKKGVVSNLFSSIGTVAGYLYLMSASATDASEYFSSDLRTEADVDFSLKEKAFTFFTDLVNQEREFREVHYAFASLAGIDGENVVSIHEKLAMLCQAWNVYLSKQKFSAKTLHLNDHYTEYDGVRILSSLPSVGGIDLGEDTKKEVTPVDVVEYQTEDEEIFSNEDPTPEEIEKRKQIERERRQLEEEIKQKQKERKKAKAENKAKHKASRKKKSLLENEME